MSSTGRGRGRRPPSEAEALRAKGWATTDDDERTRRRLRAEEEAPEVRPEPGEPPVFGTFRVGSASGDSYPVEIRSLTARANACACHDFRVNRLGTCKHVEAVLAHLRRSLGTSWERHAREGSRRVEIWLDRLPETPRVRVQWPAGRGPGAARAALEPFFAADGRLLGDPPAAMPAVEGAVAGLAPRSRATVRISTEIAPWLEGLARRRARERAREDFLADVARGKRSLEVLRVPLYPYQREGMLHLAFNERAVLADEMGLGKTAQAIAACELVASLEGAARALVVVPASLKSEWQEQIRAFTGRDALLVEGPPERRRRQYAEGAAYTLVSYEQVRADGDALNGVLAPDVVVLDEAQRIKNWQAKTAEAVKRLASRYAFVLTGTPLENRIDEIYSIMQMIDPELLGPLFRFNREFYRLGENGRPQGYRNLDRLHRRLAPVMLRRRKADVEADLPGRTVNTYFVALTPVQRRQYDDFRSQVQRLAAAGARRPLKREEQERMQRLLACMRMVCDTPYILDGADRTAPKLDELESLLDELLGDGADHKLLVFSEWVRMLELTAARLDARGLGYAWHTGAVSQRRRRREVERFRTDPDCRLLLLTESGGVGLNLQAADVVVNLDLPWNPAKLEQRIGRAWRKRQQRVVQVVNLVAEDTLEHEMLGRLEQKRTLAEGVIEGRGGVTELALPGGRGAWLERVRGLLGEATPASTGARPRAPASPVERLRREAAARWPRRLERLDVYAPEADAPVVVAVVDHGDAALREEIAAAARESFEDRAPRVEVLDRAGHGTLQRLLEAGVLAPGPSAPVTVHEAADAGPSLADARAARVPRARERLAAVARPRRMAGVLAGAGFPAEAVGPLRTALAGALQALDLWHSGSEEAPAAERTRVVHEAEGRVPAGTADLLAALEAGTVGSLDEALAGVDAAAAAVERLLGGPPAASTGP